jgi:hypothetical protein
MEITDIKLVHKSGGKSGEFNAKVWFTFIRQCN